VSVEAVPGVTDERLKPHVGEFADAGETEQVSVTALLNPLIALTATVEVAEFPGLTEAGLSGEAEMLKSWTLRVTVVVCANPLDVPVAVTV
jgi:hypothetical protein